MKFIIGLLAILTITATTLYGQEIEKCSGTVLLSTNGKVGKLTKKDVTDFLLTFGEECRNNIEYQEWSNELLFKALTHQTELVLKTIESEENRIELDEILEVISSPLLEENIDKIIQEANHVEMNKELKKRILDNLKTARDNYKD